METDARDEPDPDWDLDVLPRAYAIALRLEAAGRLPETIAADLDITPQAVGPLLAIAHAKLDAALAAVASHGSA